MNVELAKLVLRIDHAPTALERDDALCEAEALARAALSPCHCGKTKAQCLADHSRAALRPPEVDRDDEIAITPNSVWVAPGYLLRVLRVQPNGRIACQRVLGGLGKEIRLSREQLLTAYKPTGIEVPDAY